MYMADFLSHVFFLWVSIFSVRTDLTEFLPKPNINLNSVNVERRTNIPGTYCFIRVNSLLNIRLFISNIINT